MEKRAVGNSGLKVAPLALGGNVFGWTANEAISFRILDAFVDAGGTMIGATLPSATKSLLPRRSASWPD
jgi:aryl-alcohol dehydrogenase-like predicted oxidoreductase